LSQEHDTTNFDCGHGELNTWLAQQAPASEGQSARTYVVAVDRRVVAYYCLAAGSVLREGMPSAKLRSGLPQPVPIVVIGRLAVDKGFKGRGFGKGLLKDAVLRCLQASDLVGVRAVVVHAIDDEAVNFYLKFGFRRSPTNERTLILPIETAIAAL
jgi:GNAT superfamily N-acetyltransferase